MELYARVNILDGRAVRLPRGDLRTAIALDNDPVGRVGTWLEQGADCVHVVDLDAAAFGDAKNRSLIDRIIDEATGRVQIAGGIRSHVEAARLIERGAWRIVMGTAAIEDQNMVWDLCRDHPGRIAVSVDVQLDHEVATRGWTQNSGRYLEEVLIEMSSAGVVAFLVSQVNRDALADPPNYPILAEAMGTVEEPVIAAGGVRNLDDLRRLMALSVHGRRIGGVVVGREVTHGRFTVAEAQEVIAAEPGELVGPTDDFSPSVAPAMAEFAAGYLRLAEAFEQAATHARTAARHFKEGDGEQGATQGKAVRSQIAAATDELDDLPG